jgi:hypothetical protein
MKSWLIGLSIGSLVFTLVGCDSDDPDRADPGDDCSAPSDPSGEGGAGPGGTENEGGAPAVTCEPPREPACQEGLAIDGSYTDAFDGHHTVTASAWLMGESAFHVAAFHNEEHWLIARNDEANEFSPCLWSRFDWVESEGALYFCQTAFDAPSEDAARKTEAADPSDPGTTGCGNFPWSELTAQ